MNVKMKIIIVSGASASGKTSLAEKLLFTLQQEGKWAELIVMDSYYKEIPEDREISEYRATTNFDRVTMYDLDLLKNNILTLNDGHSIPKYSFEFSTNKRGVVGKITPPEFLIIEGLFSMHLSRRLPETMQKTTVFVETSSYKTIIDRRVARDAETRARKPAEVLRCEKKYVGVAYFHNIASGMRGIDVSVVNDDLIEGKQHPLDKGVDDILLRLNIRQVILPTEDMATATNEDGEKEDLSQVNHRGL